MDVGREIEEDLGVKGKYDQNILYIIIKELMKILEIKYSKKIRTCVKILNNIYLFICLFYFLVTVSPHSSSPNPCH